MIEVCTPGHVADGHVKCCDHTTDNHGSLQTAEALGDWSDLIPYVGPHR